MCRKHTKNEKDAQFFVKCVLGMQEKSPEIFSK